MLTRVDELTNVLFCGHKVKEEKGNRELNNEDNDCNSNVKMIQGMCLSCIISVH